MFRSVLIEKLNKYTFIQFVFVILPVLMVSIYGYAYLTDMLSVSRVLEYNNQIAMRAWEVDELLEVEYTGDAHHKAVVKSDFSDEAIVGVDEVIFYVQLHGVDWYQLCTKNSYTYLQSCSLFDVEALEEDGHYMISYGDHSEEFVSGDIICVATISEDGAWRISFKNDESWYYDLDELYMLELMSTDGDKYKVHISAGYEVDVDDAAINFCTSLPTNKLYYDEGSKSLVRNVSDDYAKTFILRSNILIVVLSTILYCILLWKASEEKKLVLLDNKYILRADMFAACLLPLCVIFTFIMFGK